MRRTARIFASLLAAASMASCGRATRTGPSAQGLCASSADCAAGSRCTTESGVCNPSPDCRPGLACPAVCYGTCEPPPPTPAPLAGGPCRSDSDCRTFSDYCTGCDCRALSLCEVDPVCPGPGVQCFVDPCLGREAFCDAGRCALRSKRATCPPERCGPRLGMPNRLCADGVTVAGPSDRCLANGDGSCRWEIIQCPDPAACGSPACQSGLEWCALNGRCTPPACLSCCQFGRVCKTPADCGDPACVTCPGGATACSIPRCGTVVPNQCFYPQPICP